MRLIYNLKGNDKMCVVPYFETCKIHPKETMTAQRRNKWCWVGYYWMLGQGE